MLLVNLVPSIFPQDLDALRLPGYENANELVFINGIFSFLLSTIRSRDQLLAMPLEEASKSEYKDIVSKYLGNSSSYLKDGINALNTAFVYRWCFHSC